MSHQHHVVERIPREQLVVILLLAAIAWAIITWAASRVFIGYDSMFFTVINGSWGSDWGMALWMLCWAVVFVGCGTSRTLMSITWVRWTLVAIVSLLFLVFAGMFIFWIVGAIIALIGRLLGGRE